jgi:biotin carboxyl carrier protein
MEKKDLSKLKIDDTQYTTRLSGRYLKRKPYTPPVPGSVVSFIPGTIVEILVKKGAKVNIGDDLVILEAMKMQNRIKSPVAGVVKSINVEHGVRVTRGMVLLEIE